jgi:hypothetical protein
MSSVYWYKVTLIIPNSKARSNTPKAVGAGLRALMSHWCFKELFDLVQEVRGIQKGVWGSKQFANFLWKHHGAKWLTRSVQRYDWWSNYLLHVLTYRSPSSNWRNYWKHSLLLSN